MFVTVALLILGVVLWTILLYLLWAIAGKVIRQETPVQTYDLSYDVHPEYLRTHRQGE